MDYLQPYTDKWQPRTALRQSIIGQLILQLALGSNLLDDLLNLQSGMWTRSLVKASIAQ